MSQECPPDKQPFIPLIYLGPAALTELYPYLKDCLANSLSDGTSLAELENLVISTRAWLQHDGVWMDL